MIRLQERLKTRLGAQHPKDTWCIVARFVAHLKIQWQQITYTSLSSKWFPLVKQEICIHVSFCCKHVHCFPLYSRWFLLIVLRSLANVSTMSIVGKHFNNVRFLWLLILYIIWNVEITEFSTTCLLLRRIIWYYTSVCMKVMPILKKIHNVWEGNTNS